MGFSFKPPERAGRVIFELEDATLRIGDRTLLDDAEFWLERGEHVSLVGANGTGKTTLLKALVRRARARRRQAAPRAQRQARRPVPARRGAARLGSVMEAGQRATGLKPMEARALLGRFLFSGEAAEKPVAGLSGGERRRLSLACLVASGANVLILDEPTNHLDLESREALEAALQDFPGSVVLVSHDRALLDAVGSRTVAVEDQTLHSYVGGWPEYVRVREEREALEGAEGRGQEGGAKPQPRPRAAGPPRAQRRRPQPSKNQRARPRDLEARIERAEAELQRAGGRARRPGRLERPALGREVHTPPRGGQARARRPLRPVGGRRIVIAAFTRW